MVAENGVAHTRLITTGQKSKDRVEVLSGLTAGEKVIFPVPPGLADGARSRGPAVKADRKLGLAGKFAHAWIGSKLTPLVIAGSLLLGAFAVWKLPREEEPQIIVPMVDVFVQMPGASAREVEERVTKPMEKLLWEIPGVEYIYSTSSPGMSTAIVRFLVGQDEEKSIVRLNQKLNANLDLIPPGASPPLVKPRSIDDVPILALTFWSKRYGDFELRRIAAQVDDTDQADARRFGRRSDRRPAPRDSHHSGSRRASAPTIFRRCRSSVRWVFPIADCPRASSRAATSEYLLETGEFLRTADDVRNVVAGVANDKPVFVRDVAEVTDGGEEPSQYVRFSDGKGFYPAVTIADLQAQGHQRGHRRRGRPAPSGAAARHRDSRPTSR